MNSLNHKNETVSICVNGVRRFEYKLQLGAYHGYRLEDIKLSSRTTFQSFFDERLKVGDKKFLLDCFTAIWNRQTADEKIIGTKYRNGKGLNAKDGKELLSLGHKIEMDLPMTPEDIEILWRRMIKYKNQLFHIMIAERIWRSRLP